MDGAPVKLLQRALYYTFREKYLPESEIADTYPILLRFNVSMRGSCLESNKFKATFLQIRIAGRCAVSDYYYIHDSANYYAKSVMSLMINTRFLGVILSDEWSLSRCTALASPRLSTPRESTEG
jgi:hypothetical protein